MAETAAHLTDPVIPHVPVRQWVLSFLIPLRHLFPTQPHLLSPVLRVITRAGFTRAQAQTGAITLIQRCGSAANLNIHLHCLMLDGVYRLTDGAPIFHTVSAPNPHELETLLARISNHLLKVLTRKGALVEDAPESLYLADSEHDPALAPLHAAASTYRIALGPRAGQKVLTWKDPALALSSQKAQDPPDACVSAQGFSLHANVHSGPHQRATLERLCRYITRPALSHKRLTRTQEGNVVLELKPPTAMAPRMSSCRRWNSSNA